MHDRVNIEMSTSIVIDQETQEIVTAPVGLQVYVSGENVPATSSPAAAQRMHRTRGLAIESAEDVHDQERLAKAAAAAIVEWNEAAATARRIGAALSLDRVHEYVDRIVSGIQAWVLMDVDKPSLRTIEEYSSNSRDWLIYLAFSGIAPGEVGQEDVKAFKMFLQSTGAVAEMERLRARWYGREARTLYKMDRRDVVMWMLGRSAEKARSKAARAEFLSALQAVASTFQSAPRAAYRDMYSADTASLKLVCVRMFYTSAMARGALFANPVLGVKAGKGKTSRENRIRSRMFSWDEVRALIDGCSEDAVRTPIEKARQARDRAILACGAVLGMRISDVVGLSLSDYRPEVGECGAFFIHAGKGEKDRVVDLTDKMRATIERWLMYRSLTKTTSEAMFISLHRGGREDTRKPFDRLDARSVRMMFDGRQEALGIKREGRSFHGLRHRFATRALDKGGNLFRISEQLGHSSITTTQVYIHVNALEQDNPSKLTDDVL
jgi:integrase/recombinase XerD